MLFLNLIVESDSLNKIRAIAGQEQNHSYLGFVVEDCVNLFYSFHSLQYSHIRCVANQAAHYLAKFAISNSDFVWIEETPICISNVCAFDLMQDFAK